MGITIICNCNNKIRNSNNLSEKTHKGGNIDINMEENQEKYPQKQTSTGGNININYGRNIYDTKKKKTSNDLRTVENIDVNIRRNKKYEDVQNTNGFTEKGKIDINSGGNKKQEEFTKNPYKKTDNIDINENGINQQNNYVCNDLSMSYNVLTLSALNINPLSPDFKIELSKKINEGYFPLFIKIDKLKPVFFFVKNESTLKPAFYEYLKRFEMENDIDKYTLYNQDEAIDLDIPVKYLNIKQMGVISNKKNE